MTRTFVLAALLAAMLAFPAPASASTSSALTGAQKSTLDKYLGALRAGRFDVAFTLLTADERRYFGSGANYGSIFAADRFKVTHASLLRVVPAGGRGVVAVVSEDIAFFDYAKGVEATATAKVPYGLLDDGGSVRVKDPYHPWKAFAPSGAAVETNKLRATVRKVSFFTGRVEFVVTFVNAGDETVTLLPYGRSVLRDDAGHTYHLIETKIPALTDRQLRLGLRLPPVGQYTGILTFYTPDRFTPKTLDLSIAPSLRDGADEPFDTVVPTIAVPS